jgi:hypothetical protein
MKIAVSFVLILVLVFSAAVPTFAEPQQVLQGTEVHLTLLTPISTVHSRQGDPVVAVLSQPVAFDSRIILPAGTRVNGVVGMVSRAKSFSVFRGQAYMNLTFKTIELDSRLIPVQMSILAIGEPRIDSYSKLRKDTKIIEGEVLEEKHDYRGDVVGVAVGAGGGSLVGLVFSNVARGLGLGFVAGGVYVVARKGKEVELPANSGMLVRLDSSVNVPSSFASNLFSSSSGDAGSR